MLLRKAGEDKENSIFCLDDLHNALMAKVEQKRHLREEEQRTLKIRISQKLREKVAEQAALRDQNDEIGTKADTEASE